MHIFYKYESKRAHSLDTFQQEKTVKIGHIDHEISTVLVPGRKFNLLLPGTIFLLPRTFRLAPAGDTCGKIKLVRSPSNFRIHW